MDLDLRDRVVLISGGAKGIGAAIVRAVAGEKGTPVVLDRDAAAGESLVAELRQSGHRALFVPAELTSSESCAQAVERVVRELGALHALVNNAGVNDRVGLEDGSPERYRASVERNLFHFYDLAHHALPHLRRVQAGAIVNIASKAAVTGQGGTSGYASAKGAILALTREWAVELLPYGIRVNAIVPAEVMTPLYESWLATFSSPDEKLNAIVAKIPLGKRMTKPEEIAATAVFLLSAKSAGHITGQHLFVDGGYVHLDRALG